MRTGRTVLAIAVTFVGHSEVESVGPEGRVTEGSGDCRVIEEGLLFHHEELVIAADPEIGRSDADNGVVGDVGEPLDDEPHAGHLLSPGLETRFTPILFTRIMSNIRGNERLGKQ